MKISSKYSHHTVPGESNTEPSLTHQSFKSECDVNTIMDRFKTTGSLTDPTITPSRSPIFGDFTNVPDFRGAQEIIIESNNLFMSLPSDIREEFDHDPALFLDYCSDPSNASDLVDLGLIEPTFHVEPSPTTPSVEPIPPEK